jgi:glycosyltransferase involved in cell wall biosynthesis
VHVAQIGFHVDPQRRDPERLLHDWPTLVDVAEAVSRAGARVSILQACSRSASLMRKGVSYHFLAADAEAPAAARAASAAALIRRLEPEVLHVHGLCFPAEVSALAQQVPDIPILLQDHASGVPPFWRRRAWRRGFAAAAAVAFCSRRQSEPFLGAGLLHERTPVYEVPESSSHFTPGEQAQARSLTRLAGDPCLLWVGRLNRLKDPLTVLDGVSEAARHLPDLQLWCCYGSAPLLQPVQHRIDTDPLLRSRVHLLGEVPHEHIQQMMRAADVFVSGSRLEGSGYALIEALACGLAPVVTDIPSFRSLTGEGRVGSLWTCGDARSLSRALLDVASRPRAALRSEVRAFFDRSLCFDAVGQTLANVYGELQ